MGENQPCNMITVDLVFPFEDIMERRKGLFLFSFFLFPLLSRKQLVLITPGMC